MKNIRINPTIKELASYTRDNYTCEFCNALFQTDDYTQAYDNCLDILSGKAVYKDYTPEYSQDEVGEKIERVLTDNGGDVDICRYLDREPECYYEYLPTEKTTAKIAVVTGFAATVPNYKLNQAGNTIAHKIRSYEVQGIACAVDLLYVTLNQPKENRKQKAITSKIIIKESYHELNESLLYFFLSSYFFRSFLTKYCGDQLCKLYKFDKLDGCGYATRPGDNRLLDLSQYDQTYDLRIL